MRLREALEKIIEKQQELNLILVRLTTTVEEHEKRSTNLEKHVSLLENKVEKVQKHVDMVNGFARIFTGLIIALGGMIGIIAALKKLIQFL